MSTGTEEPEVQTEEPQEAMPEGIQLERTEPEEEQTEPIAGEEEIAEETLAEEPSGEAEAAPEEEPPGAWITQDVRDFAESAGLSREDLDDFADRYELERMVRHRDRGFISDAQQPPPQQAVPQQQAPQPQQVQPQHQRPTFDQEVLGEDVAKALDSQAQYYEGLLAYNTQYVQGVLYQLQFQQAEQEKARFADVLDSMGETDGKPNKISELFGRTGARTSAQAKNYERVLDAYSWLPNARANPAMVQRAINQEFWPDLKKEVQEQRRQKVTRQNRKVLRSGQARSASARQSDVEETEGIGAQDEKELIEYHKKLAAEGA